VTLGHPTNQDPQTFESQQFGPASPNSGGYLSQPAMWASSNVVAWWTEYKGWPLYAHYHNGLDVAGPQGFPLRALEAGKITELGWRTNGGGYVAEVQIRAGTQYSLNHCSGFPAGLAVGQRVAKGQIIAFIGSTGTATGNHCHVSLDIDERGPDYITRRLMWNPKLFMTGGPFAADPRIQPLSSPAPTPPTTTVNTSMEAWQVAVRYRATSGSITIKAGKPWRTRATVNQAPQGYFSQDTTLRKIGRFDKTGSYDDWFLGDFYAGNGIRQVIVTSVDAK